MIQYYRRKLILLTQEERTREMIRRLDEYEKAKTLGGDYLKWFEAMYVADNGEVIVPMYKTG